MSAKKIQNFVNILILANFLNCRSFFDRLGTNGLRKMFQGYQKCGFNADPDPGNAVENKVR